MWTMYTDGAGCTQHGVAAAGFVGDGFQQAVAFQGTSQQAEVLAVLLALRHALDHHQSAVVLTDSANVIGWVTGGFRTRSEPIRELVSCIHRVLKQFKERHLTAEVTRVAGHTGIPGNEHVDRLCKAKLQEARAGHRDAPDVLACASISGPLGLGSAVPAVPTLALLWVHGALHHLVVEDSLAGAYRTLLIGHAVPGCEARVPTQHLQLVAALPAAAQVKLAAFDV